MAHVFPRKLDQNDQPIEAESINTNIQQVVQEVSGRLNEQNLRGHATVPAERFVPNYTEVEASSVLNVHRNGWIVEVQGLGDGGGFFSNAGDPDLDKFNGIQYAIALDGSVLHDSILGGADRMNDPFGEAWNALNHSFVTDITFQVTPGTHEVALYARFCLPHDFQTKVFTTNTYMLVCNRELIVMEMK